MNIDEETAEIVRRLAALQATIAERTTEADSLKGELRKRLTAGEHYIDGRPAIRVTQPRRFDIDEAAALLPSDEIREKCKKATYDPALIKVWLPPVVADLCMKPHGSQRIEIL